MAFNQLQAKAGWLVFALVLSALAAAGPARADGQIYLCVDAGGHRELTDSNKNGSCKKLDLPGAITSPPKRTAAPHPNANVAPAPADFPKVDNAQQKARDADRRQILQDELKGEEQKMAALKKDFNGGEPERNGNERTKYQERVAQMKDDIARVEKNIDALKREIAGIR